MSRTLTRYPTWLSPERHSPRADTPPSAPSAAAATGAAHVPVTTAPEKEMVPLDPAVSPCAGMGMGIPMAKPALNRQPATSNAHLPTNLDSKICITGDISGLMLVRDRAKGRRRAKPGRRPVFFRSPSSSQAMCHAWTDTAEARDPGPFLRRPPQKAGARCANPGKARLGPNGRVQQNSDV